MVDAKAPLAAYLDALEATDDETRRSRLADHARQLRTHLTALSRKSYWDQFQPSPEFVVLFVPGEMFFSAALEQDPELLEFGVEQRVILATPTTLIALLRAVAYGWRQDTLAENAKKVSELGAELYARLATMGDHFAAVGARLEAAVKSYNLAVGSLETRVLVTARKFRDLKAVGGDVLLDPPAPIDVLPREVRAEDLLPAPGAEASGLGEPVEDLHAHRIARLHVAALVLEHDEAVRLRHRAQHAGALAAGDAHRPRAVRAALEDAALELRAARFLPQRRLAGHAEERESAGVGAAGEREQCVAHEAVEGHHHRHRIPRQAEEPGAADRAPNAIGRPGRIAIFQNRTSPSRPSSSRVKSASPTETPPELTMASALAAASLKARSSAAGSSRTTPMSISSTPSRASIPYSV